MTGSSPDELESVVVREEEAVEPGDELIDDGGELDNDEDRFMEVRGATPFSGRVTW